MKRFVDFAGDNLTGGAPFANEDFFQTNGELVRTLRGAAEAVYLNITGDRINPANGLGENVFGAVLAGLTFTVNGPNFDIPDSYLLLSKDPALAAPGLGDYEIYFLAAQTITPGEKFILPAADLFVTRQYGDGNTKNFLVTKTAVISDTNPAGGSNFKFTPNTTDFIRIGELQLASILTSQLQIVGTNRILGIDSTNTNRQVKQLTNTQVRGVLQTYRDIELMSSASTGGVLTIRQQIKNATTNGWNMDADANYTISLSNDPTYSNPGGNRVAVNGVTIFRDDGVEAYDLRRGGEWLFTGNQITLQRAASGFFDGPNFDDANAFRGIIQYTRSES